MGAQDGRAGNQRGRVSTDTIAPCRCGDPAEVTVHDNHYWVSCSCRNWHHDVYDCPEAGGFEGFETLSEAVEAWNEMMSGEETER